MSSSQGSDYKFTENQLIAFARYEHVRREGKFNMFDPRARRETGLSGDEYRFVMDFYDELRKAYDSTDREEF